MNSSNNYRAVLFDFEGTLVDFQWKMDEAVRETLAALVTSGLDEKNFFQCDYATLFNKAVEESARLNLPPGQIRQKIEEVYDRFDWDALQRWTPRKDTRDVLENIMSRGLLVGLVTNVGQKALSVLLRRFHFDKLFNVIITRNDVTRLKPEGEGIHQALAALRVEKGDSLFVGDSVTDIKAAKEVGIDVAVVLGGESKLEDIKAHEPQFVLRSLSKVLHLCS